MNNQRDTTVYNIVQLSYFTILHIIGFIECNIDKICLTLSCKSLFTRFKNKLLFKWNAPCRTVDYKKYEIDPLTDKCIKNGFRLKSYQQSYHLSTNHLSYYFISSIQQLKVLNNYNNGQDWEDELEEDFDYREWVNIGREIIPYKQHTIIFTHRFNEYIPPNTIPKHIRHIKFGQYFNQPIDHPDILPPKLQSLIMESFYEHNLTLDVLPSSLKVFKRPKYLTLDYPPQFNDGLEVLTLQSGQYIGGGILPSTLKCLIINRLYSHKIMDGDLPTGIKNLQIGIEIIRDRLTLPDHVEYVRLPSICDNPQFDNLQYLRHIDNFPVSKLHLLPPSVTHLDTNSDNTLDWSLLPRGLKHISIMTIFIINQSHPSPPNLKSIYIYSYDFQGPIDFIPPTIETILLSQGFSPMLHASKIPNLKYLIMSVNYQHLDQFLNQPDLPSSFHTLEWINDESQHSTYKIHITPSITTLIGHSPSFLKSCNRGNVKRLYLNGEHKDIGVLTLGDVITLEQIHMNDIALYKPQFDIRRLSVNSILIFSNSSVIGGIITYNEQDLNKSFMQLLLDDNVIINNL